MKRRFLNAHLRAAVIWGAVLTVTMTGCGFYKKMQANKKNGEVETVIAEIQAQGANRYLPREFQRISQMLGEARNAVNAGNYDQALQIGDEALGLADQIRARLPQAKAVIEQKKRQLVELQAKITEVVEQVKVLGPDETAIIEGQTELDAAITTVQNAQAQVVEGEAGYDAVLQKASDFLGQATVTLARLEKEKAEQLIIRIENAWSDAVALDVLKYVSESEDVPHRIEQAKALVSSASYRAALEQFGDLPEEIGRYRERAREKRAEARIEQAERLIELAEANPEASLDAIETAKQATQEASDALQEGNYDSAYASADSAIQTARKEVKAIEDDLRAQIDELEARVEQSLDWEADKKASDLYKEALGYLDAAKEYLADILFDDCQDAIDRGAAVIEDAIAEARTKGLTERIEKDSQALQDTQKIGAFQYLREEYQEIQELLGEAERLVTRSSFDEAEEVLAKAEEKTQGLEVGLRDLAQNRLAAAESAYQEALQAGAEEHAEEILAEAARLLDESRNAAASADWKRAITAAESSQAKAEVAAAQSYRIRTDRLRPVAEEEIEQAREAGAASYAAEIYNKALAANMNAKTAYQEQHYRTALEELSRAKDLAVQARQYQIDQAQEALDSALAAKAGEYQEKLIGRALENLSKAREKMEEKEYAASRELALSAEKLAEEAEAKTWEERAKTALAELSREVREAEENRAPKYAESEFERVSRTLEEAQAAATAGDYKTAYLAADRGSREMEEVRARLADEARLVRGDYDRLVGELKTYVEDEFGTALHLKATERLGRIDEAILRNEFRRIFDLYEEGEHEVKSQIVAVKLHNINKRRKQLEQRILQADQEGLFALVDRGKEDLLADLQSVEYDPALDRLKPEVDYYTETIRALARVEDEVDRLQEMALANIDDRIRRIRTDIDNAGKIGAKDLVPTLFDSAVDNYEKARDMAYLMRTGVEGARKVTFVELTKQLELAESDADRLNETAIVKNNSVNYLRDLVFWTYDMTRFLDQWYPVEEFGYEMILIAAPSSEVDVYKQMQSGITAHNLVQEAERLYKRLAPITPPDPQKELHAMALASFELFVECAENFHRFGQYDRYPKRLRERLLAKAFQDLEKLHILNDRLLMAILEQVKAYDMEEFEREFADEFNALKAYIRRDKTSR